MSDQKIKGRWRTVEHSWSRIGIYSGNEGIAVLDIYDEATEETEDELHAKMEANARLIAAAPELLEALIAYAEAYNENPHLGPRGSAVDAAFLRAQEVIRKATVGQS